MGSGGADRGERGQGDGTAAATLRRARRLALDLHDGPLQTVTLLDGELQALEGELAAVFEAPNAAELVTGRVADLRAMLAQLQRELRDIVAGSALSTSSIDLYESLVEVEQSFRKRSPANLDVQIDEGLRDLTDSQQLAVFHIAQEAMSNVAAHARASSVALSIRRETQDVVVEIADDGIGFDERAADIGRVGLTSMRERAEMLGGVFRFESRPGGPTRIVAVLPAWDRNATSGS